jgi:O-Antigen ligase
MVGANARWALLALVISTGPIMVLSHGLLGTGSVFTGIFIALSTASLVATGRWKTVPNICDLTFALFVLSIVISSILNGKSDDSKEYGLLILSLAAYPAGRFFSAGMVRPTFLWTTAMIVFLGAAVTLYALFQYAQSYGKVWVFGRFEAAPAQFLSSLAFLLFGLMALGLDAARTRMVLALTVPPAAIFAAAMVRFTFVAMAASVLVAIVIAPGKERKYLALILVGVIGAVALGLSSRPQTSARFIAYSEALLPHSEVSAPTPTSPAATTQLPHSVVSAPTPSSPAATTQPGCPPREDFNTIIIRQQLLLDAIRILPDAGLFGVGLGGFKARSCVEATEVHNTTVQSFVEFGWIGGLCFAALVILACVGLPWRAPNPEARFVIYGFAFTALTTLGHGNLSTDALLFLFMGQAARLQSAA